MLTRIAARLALRRDLMPARTVAEIRHLGAVARAAREMAGLAIVTGDAADLVVAL
jgi:hypothetical protein